jgi:RNA 2',3'-cyclic 3'-phosphodiesterase
VSAAIRAFVALPLPREAVESCLRAQRHLRQTNRDVHARWTAQEQMHVTVKFLGNVAGDQLERLCETITQAAGTHSDLHATVLGLDGFPTPKRARVIVLRLELPQWLGELARRVETAAARFGIPAERRAFRPHVTLARLKQPVDVSSWIQDAPIPLREVTLRRLVLFRSDLARDGARYTPLAEVDL